MVIGGEAKPHAPDPPRARRFNGAADGDRRRDEHRLSGALVGVPASTEPPMVIGGEFPPSDEWKAWLAALQRSRRW